IRDRTVTGVQTCALPILRITTVQPATPIRIIRLIDQVKHHLRVALEICGNRLPPAKTRLMEHPIRVCACGTALYVIMEIDNDIRSEERRVGKECSTRWTV